jgi:diguanylate cyclase (GGDEF)-like protein
MSIRLARLTSSAKSLRGRLAARDDTEHVQGLIRIVFGLLIAAYMYSTVGAQLDVHLFFVGFLAVSCGIFAHIVEHPQRSAGRKAFGPLVDIGTTTFVMLNYGEIGAPLYGIYLWVTFGNGFRFGVRWLYASHALSLLGFSCVIAFNAFWHGHPLLTGGLFLLLAALPPYGAVLLRALEKANQRLREEATRDVLTGLFNRRYLMDSLERELHRARRRREHVGVMMLDIDHFKRLNDTFGHAAGDEVLRSVAQLMLTLVRSEDVLCRFGGEEFVWVQMNAPPSVMIERAEKLREKIAYHHISYNGRPVGPVTLSIGIAFFPYHGVTADAVLQSADTALYRAKQLGRNRVVMLARTEENERAAAEPHSASESC